MDPEPAPSATVGESEGKPTGGPDIPEPEPDKSAAQNITQSDAGGEKQAQTPGPGETATAKNTSEVPQVEHKPPPGPPSANPQRQNSANTIDNNEIEPMPSEKEVSEADSTVQIFPEDAEGVSARASVVGFQPEKKPSTSTVESILNAVKEARPSLTVPTFTKSILRHKNSENRLKSGETENPTKELTTLFGETTRFSGARPATAETEYEGISESEQGMESSGDADPVGAVVGGALPKLSHQFVRNVTDTGFPEVYQPQTAPIYSKVDLRRLISSFDPGSSFPPVPEIVPPMNVPSSVRAQEFEKIYGKLRRKSAKEEEVGSLMSDQMQEQLHTSNFVKAIAKNYLYRLVLVGSHLEDQEKMIDWMHDCVDDVNSHVYSEAITGLFLIYPKHFVHVLEGSEDGLTKVIKMNADQFEPNGYDWKLEYQGGKVTVRQPIHFTTVKVLVVGMFRIHQRAIVTGWKAERAGSSKMNPDDVPSGDFRERLYAFTRQCIIMALTLSKLTPVRPPDHGDTDHEHHHHARRSHMHGKGGKDAHLRKSTRRRTQNEGNSALPGADSRISMIELKESRIRFEEQKRKRATSIAQIVPKPAMIEYILRKNPKRKIQLRTVREHLEYLQRVPTVMFFEQFDWPLAGKLAPYD